MLEPTKTLLAPQMLPDGCLLWGCVGHKPTRWQLQPQEGWRTRGLVLAELTRQRDGSWVYYYCGQAIYDFAVSYGTPPEMIPFTRDSYILLPGKAPSRKTAIDVVMRTLLGDPTDERNCKSKSNQEEAKATEEAEPPSAQEPLGDTWQAYP